MAKIYWAYDQGAINTHQTLQLVSMETTHSALFRCSSLTCQSGVMFALHVPHGAIG